MNQNIPPINYTVSSTQNISRTSIRTMQRIDSLPEDSDPILQAATTQVEDTEGVQLRNPFTNEIIPIPTPSNDPNDPLNW